MSWSEGNKKDKLKLYRNYASNIRNRNHGNIFRICSTAKPLKCICNRKREREIGYNNLYQKGLFKNYSRPQVSLKKYVSLEEGEIKFLWKWTKKRRRRKETADDRYHRSEKNSKAFLSFSFTFQYDIGINGNMYGKEHVENLKFCICKNKKMLI